MAGCEAIKCSTIEEIASRSGALLAEISSSSKHVDPSRRSAADDRFQAFHSYVYDILRPEGKKYIEKVSDNSEEDVHACINAYKHTNIHFHICTHACINTYMHTSEICTCADATRQPIPSPTPFCLASFQLAPSLSPSSFTFFTDCTPFLAQRSDRRHPQQHSSHDPSPLLSPSLHLPRSGYGMSRLASNLPGAGRARVSPHHAFCEIPSVSRQDSVAKLGSVERFPPGKVHSEKLWD